MPLFLWTQEMNLPLGIPIVEDELLDQFAIEIIKAPADKDQAAFRLCMGDFQKARALMMASETPAFIQRLIAMRNAMPKSERLIKKDDFMIECKEAMANTQGALKLEWAKFYAKMAGFVDESATINNMIHVVSVPAAPQQNNVHEVNDWEARTLEHQTNLKREAKKLNRGDDE